MNVLIIPEDFRKDEFILKPIISAVLTALGRPRARVIVCKDPLLRGISQALNEDSIVEIVERYKGMVDLFLLCVDRDGKAGRQMRLNQLEASARTLLTSDRAFFAENAWQELEVWVLAGLDLPKGWSWTTIRAERDPKELYFLRLAASKGLLDEPGQGRKTLAVLASTRYSRIRKRCPEDVRRMEKRIKHWIGGHS